MIFSSPSPLSPLSSSSPPSLFTSYTTLHSHYRLPITTVDDDDDEYYLIATTSSPPRKLLFHHHHLSSFSSSSSSFSLLLVLLFSFSPFYYYYTLLLKTTHPQTHTHTPNYTTYIFYLNSVSNYIYVQQDSFFLSSSFFKCMDESLLYTPAMDTPTKNTHTNTHTTTLKSRIAI